LFPWQQAALADDAAVMLKDVVVTATKTLKTVSEAPATVTVVTAQEIENKNAERADEALAGAPGVFVRGLGSGQPSNYMNQITLRGIPGYYRTGVLVDGVPINNAFSGGVNMSLVPVDEIRQIEVVPGPFSSLYGGAGMAGVINIITKVPEKREVLVKGEVGSHNFRSLDLGYRDLLSDSLGISLTYGRKQSDGYANEYVTKRPSGTGGTAVTGWDKTSTTSGTTTYIVGDKGKEAWEQDNYGARFFLKLSPDSRLSFEAAYLTHRTKDGGGNTYLRDNGVPFSSGAANIDGARTSVNATDFLKSTNGEDLYRYSATYEGQLGSDVKLKANLSYQDNQYWYTSIASNATDTRGAGSVADIPNKMTNGDVQLGFPVGTSQYFVVGASANDSTLNKKVYALDNWRDKDATGALGDWADGNSTSMAFYVQDEIAVSNRLTLYAGARYDRWTTDGTIHINGTHNEYDNRTSSAVNPKASAVYKFEQGTVVKGAIGKAFRAPNLSDMYSTYGSSTIYWSNPDLKPEKVTTAEIGVEHEFKTATLLRATYYRSNISDLIYSSTSGVNRYKFNAGKAETEGIDLEARQRLTHGLTAFINATFVDTTITENEVRPASVGHQIPLQAQTIANLGLEGSHGPWSGSIIGTYVGKMYGTDDNTDSVNNVPGSYDPFFTVNARLAYKIDKTLTASLSVRNLLDRDYFLGNTKADGRTVFLGLGFRY
jgi:iron complex outermembrane receptor protein